MNAQDIVKRFCDQCVMLRVAYNEYCILYETSEARRDLLNEVAKNFFHDLQEILIQYILLNICKLTDPPHPRQSDNLTVVYILELVGTEAAKKLALDELSEKIHSFRIYIRDARHKIIAHLDKDTALSKGFLGAFPREANDAFWRDLQEFVNRVYDHYFGGPFPLDAVNMYNAEDLVDALKKSVHYDDYFKDKGRQKMEEGNRMRYKDA